MPALVLSATLELVSPAYAGGADVAKTNGLRPATLKALLRFWWRAMFPGMAPSNLYRIEEGVFGSTRVGQGVRVVPAGPIAAAAETPRPYTLNNKPPLFYLAYGTQASRDQLARQRTRAGTTFSYRFCAPSGLAARVWESFQRALWLLGAFGGFGTRSRRGFGSLRISVALPGLPDLTACATRASLAQALGEGLATLFPARSTAVPQHTAFTTRSRVIVGPEKRTWEAALIEAGWPFYELRRLLGTTFDHGVLGEPVGMDFLRVTTYGLSDGRPSPPTNKATLGAAFGLPQNYQYPGVAPRWKPSIEASLGDALARRASPLFIRVSKLATGRFVPVALWLPSLFLPDSYEVCFKDGRSTWPLLQPDDCSIGWLFSRETRVPVYLDGAKTDPVPVFRGYPGRDGWEVVW